MRFLTLLVVLLTSTLGFTQENSTNMQGKAILILLAQQRLYAIEDGKIIYDFHVSTGRKGMETPTGRTTIQAKFEWGRALPEYGGEKLHYVLRMYMYDPKMKKKRRLNIHAYPSVPLYPASHGCPRLAEKSAKKLFYWAEVGTPVITMEGPPPPKKKG